MTSPRRISEAVQDLHIQHLINQRDHLFLERDRHLQWIGEANDLEIRAFHQALADSLDEVVLLYEDLIAALKRAQDHAR